MPEIHESSFRVHAHLLLEDASPCCPVRLFVTNRFYGAESGQFATCYHKQNGLNYRFRRASLPIRATATEAETDLIEFADKRRWLIERD